MANLKDNDVLTISKAAREASHKLQSLTPKQKNDALEQIRISLKDRREEVIAANKRDLEAAAVAVQEGKLSSNLLKRLDISGPNGKKFDDLLQGLADTQKLPDPTGM